MASNATRVQVDGAQELRTLAEGFNEMTATVAEQHRRLEHLAATDHLTGLANHRSFHDALGRALAFAEREGHSLALVALDLDHFKALNDAYGHAYGDRVLKSAAANLQNSVRAGDLWARVGGEEFALLLPEATPRVPWRWPSAPGWLLRRWPSKTPGSAARRAWPCTPTTPSPARTCLRTRTPRCTRPSARAVAARTASTLAM